MDIFEPNTFHYLVTFAVAFTIIILAVMLVCIHVPADSRLSNFRRAKHYLSLSYFILGSINFIYFFTQKDVQNSSLLDATTLLIASYQALLFTSTMLVLIEPSSVKQKFVLSQLGFITLGGICLFIILFLYQDSLYTIIFYTVVALYLLQISYYTYLFRLRNKVCLKLLEDHYDEDENARLRWVNFSFYGALSIGILAIIALFVNLYLYTAFSIIYTLFYAYMVYQFYNYQINSIFIISTVAQNISISPNNDDSSDLHDIPNEFLEENYIQFENALNEWIKEKRFTDKDISINQIAKQLESNHYFLRHYFKNRIGTDFRTWRIELRVREAQDIIKNHPEWPVNEICEMVGIRDRSNFHRQFNKVAGMTPTDYRKSYSSKSE